MTVRLPLLLVQSKPPGSAGVRLVEQVIGELIGRPGVDLILIEDLSLLDSESSDRLTLESINSHAAVLDWSPPDATLTTLRGLGFDGQRWPHASDPEAHGADAHGRKIFFFDLNRFADASELCAAIHALLKSQQVKTFSLGAMAPATAPTTPLKQVEPQKAEPQKEGFSGRATKQARHKPTEVSPAPAEPTAPAGPLDLDQLADQLDEMDL